MSGTYQLLPDLTEDERDDLTRDIKANGVQVPIIRDEAGVIIDGHHRNAIAEQLGKQCPFRTVRGLTDAQKRDMALRLNMHRRSLTREQKRELIAASLKADPELSDRQHAERTAASPTTVGTVRDDLVKSGDVSKLDTRKDSAGREQPATKPSPAAPIKHTETHTDKTETWADPTTGEVVDPPAASAKRPTRQSAADNPAALGSAAKREALAKPWPVFETKMLADLKRWSEWLDLDEVGGIDGVIASLREVPIPNVAAEQAESAAKRLDSFIARMTRLRCALEAERTPRLRRVQ